MNMMVARKVANVLDVEGEGGEGEGEDEGVAARKWSRRKRVATARHRGRGGRGRGPPPSMLVAQPSTITDANDVAVRHQRHPPPDMKLLFYPLLSCFCR